MGKERNCLSELHQILVTHFGEGELRTLCFDLDIDYNDLPGQGKADKARELVVFLERRDRIFDLVELGIRQRPDVSWRDVLETIGGVQSTPPSTPPRLILDIENTGIERIWPKRRDWQYDHVDGMQRWRERVCQANRVEIMSTTLLNFGLRDEPFREALQKNIARGASVRLLVYKPDSDVQLMRAADEYDPPGEMQSEIRSALSRLAQVWGGLKAPDSKENLKVRLTTQSLHFVQLIRADELMLVAFYLSGKPGGDSPTLQLRGTQSTYFSKYAEQFSIMWRRGEPFDLSGIENV